MNHRMNMVRPLLDDRLASVLENRPVRESHIIDIR